MNRPMNCQEFHSAIDAWLDEELNDTDIERMLRHAKECPSCMEEMNQAREMRDMMMDMDKDVSVPLQAQAAWRNAVKAEAAHRKSGKIRVFTRTVTSVAAAFAVLAGCTFAFRSAGLLTPVSGSQTMSAGVETVYTQDTENLSAYPGTLLGRSTEGRSVRSNYIAGDGSSDIDTSAPETTVDTQDELLAATAKAQSSVMLAKSAVRSINTRNYADDFQSISDLVKEYGGYFSTSNFDTFNGIHTTHLIARIPAEEFDTFLETMDGIGEIIVKEQYQEDVSANYIDLQSRLDAATAEKDRLYELISTAADADELKNLNTMLNEQIVLIESLQSQSKSLQNSVDNATVDITLNEITDETTVASEESPAPDDTASALTTRMSEGFQMSVNELGNFFNDMAVSLAIIAPVAAICVPLIVIITVAAIVIHKKRKGKREK